VNNDNSKPAVHRAAERFGGFAGSALAVPEPLDRAMSRYAEGDDSAFGEVWAQLTPRLEAFIGRLCGSPALTEDLVQETFLRMHRARREFAKDRAVLPWACAIARNCFTSQARTRKAKYAREWLDIGEHDLAAGPEASAEEATSARQGAEVIERALERMSPINRQAFVLTRVEGRSIAAAAQIAATSRAAMKLRVFRAYEALRAALTEMERYPLRADSE
jgi:RNA polymerase sigma-70 factor, ECF subfamily